MDPTKILDALDQRDLVKAYKVFTALIGTAGGAQATTSATQQAVMLQRPLLILLEGILEDNGKTPGLPAPADLLAKLSELNIADEAVRRNVLKDLLVANADPQTRLLPVFEVTLRAEQRVTPNGKALIVEPPTAEGVMRTEPELMYLFRNSTTIYAAFLRLSSAGIKSPLLNSLSSYLPRIDLPETARLGSWLASFNIPEKTSIMWLANDISMRKMLTNKTKLRNKLDELRENNLEGLDLLFSLLPTYEPLPEHTYTAFIDAYLYRKSTQDRVIKVWNAMIAAGHTPSVESWTELLSGYARSQDRLAAVKVWERMRAAKIKPDVAAWTSMIHAHLYAGEILEGLKTLKAMIAAGVLPNTVTINATVDGLLRFGRMAEARGVLALADKYKVVPDRTTYNTLLRRLLQKPTAAASRARPGHASAVIAECLQILEQMFRNKVDPDTYTLTILIDNVARHASSETASKQVFDLIGQLSSLGLNANVYTFTALINGLLKAENFPAAMAAREAMNQAGVRPNSDTFTVLIKYALDRGDLEQMAKLWEEIDALGVRRDLILWTETIWGLAQLGEKDWMHDALQAMRREGLRLSLKSATGIVKSLARRKLLAEALDICRTVVHDGWVTGPADSEMGRIAKEFWELVMELGGNEAVVELKEIKRKGEEERAGVQKLVEEERLKIVEQAEKAKAAAVGPSKQSNEMAERAAAIRAEEQAQAESVQGGQGAEVGQGATAGQGAGQVLGET